MSQHRETGDDEIGDATIAGADDDATIAVPAANRPDDATIVVSQRAEHQQSGAVHAERAASRKRDAAVGAPVVEREEIPPELAKLFFKNPLDSKRRAPASPFPTEQSSLPRGGIRGGIPVVYGARSEGFAQGGQRGDLGRSIGPAPAGYAIPVASREALPSLARLSRRFSALAWVGAFVVPVIAGVGLWWVITELLRP